MSGIVYRITKSVSDVPLPAGDWPAAGSILQRITFSINCVTTLAMVAVQLQLLYILIMIAMFGDPTEPMAKTTMIFVSPLIIWGMCVSVASKLSSRRNWLCLPVALIPLLVYGGFQYFLSQPVAGSH